MAYPTTVNDQITDSVTQPNIKVLGDAPAIAMGHIYQSLAQTTGILMQNATAAQQQMNIILQATTTQGVAMMYSLTSAATAATAEAEKNAAEGAAAAKTVADAATSALAEAAPEAAEPAPATIPDSFASAVIHLQSAHALGLAIQNAAAFLQASCVIATAAKAAAFTSYLVLGKTSPAGPEVLHLADQSLVDARDLLEDLCRFAEPASPQPSKAASATAG
jgi:hypothetical protein